MMRPMPKKKTTFPRLKKKYFQHGLGLTPESRADLKKLAASITLLREEYEIPKSAFAKRIGIAHSSLNHIEGARCFPSFPVYRSICRELGQPKPPLL